MLHFIAYKAYLFRK